MFSENLVIVENIFYGKKMSNKLSYYFISCIYVCVFWL